SDNPGPQRHRGRFLHRTDPTSGTRRASIPLVQVPVGLDLSGDHVLDVTFRFGPAGTAGGTSPAAAASIARGSLRARRRVARGVVWALEGALACDVCRGKSRRAPRATLERLTREASPGT